MYDFTFLMDFHRYPRTTKIIFQHCNDSMHNEGTHICTSGVSKQRKI